MLGRSSVGELLREWRLRRGFSQLHLAGLAEVSARHLSFVETGRTTPSRDMVLHLAAALSVPLRERNRLLLAAGYAPAFRDRPLDSVDMLAARQAIERLLTSHEPFPAIAVDSRWNLLVANSAVDVFLDEVSPVLLAPPVNMMRLGLHPQGFAPRIRNLPQVRSFLLMRLRRQIRQTGSRELADLYDELAAYGAEDPRATGDLDGIALELHLDHRGEELVLLNSTTTFGTATDITLAEVSIEAYFPADEHTARILRGRAPA